MKLAAGLLTMVVAVHSAAAFTLHPIRSVPGARPLMTTTTPSVSLSATSTDTPEDLSKMRLSQIQVELKRMGVKYSDCFDRESLTQRLLDARKGDVLPTTTTSPEAESASVEADEEKEAMTDSKTTVNSEFDREATLTELRGMKVAELRTECSQRNIRWATMIEKEDLVQALAKAREESAGFSLSGALKPGEVTEVTGEQLETELASTASTPLLLDVYATWCGPCQLMAPQLEQAAEELGDSVRVVKIDSDKFPAWSSRLKVGGFPTVVVFDRNGQEAQRIEGAVMKPQLLELARAHM